MADTGLCGRRSACLVRIAPLARPDVSIPCGAQMLEQRGDGVVDPVGRVMNSMPLGRSPARPRSGSRASVRRARSRRRSWGREPTGDCGMTRVGGESHFDHRADEREFLDGHRLVDQYLTLQVAGHPNPLRASTLVAARHGAQHSTTGHHRPCRHRCQNEAVCYDHRSPSRRRAPPDEYGRRGRGP